MECRRDRGYLHRLESSLHLFIFGFRAFQLETRYDYSDSFSSLILSPFFHQVVRVPKYPMNVHQERNGYQFLHLATRTTPRHQSSFWIVDPPAVFLAYRRWSGKRDM